MNFFLEWAIDLKVLYVVGLVDVEVSEVIRTPLQVSDGAFVTNNAEFIRGLLPDVYVNVIGLIEYQFLTSGRLVVFKEGEVSSEEEAHAELINLLRSTHGLLMSLWMGRDCSVNCDVGYVLGLDVELAHSNTLNPQYTLANGASMPLALNMAEFEVSSKLALNFFRGLKEKDKPLQTAMQKSTGRINVSTYHIQAARSATDVAIKVSSYCSFFESLFSTSSAELSHQLSERIAFSLAISPLERLEIYKKVKRAYGVRSKVVHGDVISKQELQGLAEISEGCDKLARDIYSKMSSSIDIYKLFGGSNDEIDSHMRDLIFGVRTEL